MPPRTLRQRTDRPASDRFRARSQRRKCARSTVTQRGERGSGHLLGAGRDDGRAKPTKSQPARSHDASRRGPGPLDRQRKCCVPLIALCPLTVRPLHISLEVHWERRFVLTEPVTQQTLNRPAERIAGFHSFVRSFENGYQVLGAKVKMYSVVPWASGRSGTSGYAGSGRRLFGREGAGGAGNVSAEAV